MPAGEEQALTRAAQLQAALEGFTNELSGVRTEIAQERSDRDDALKEEANSRRRGWIFFGLLMLFLAVSIMASGVAIFQNRSTLDEVCKRDNQLRQANVDLWQPILDRTPLPTDPGPDVTEQERKEYEDDLANRQSFEEALRTGFARYDC